MIRCWLGEAGQLQEALKFRFQSFLRGQGRPQDGMRKEARRSHGKRSISALIGPRSGLTKLACSFVSGGSPQQAWPRNRDKGASCAKGQEIRSHREAKDSGSPKCRVAAGVEPL